MLVNYDYNKVWGGGGGGTDDVDDDDDDDDDSDKQVPRDIAKCRMAGTGGEVGGTDDDDDDDDSDKQKPEPDSVPDSRTDGKPDVLIPFSDSTPPTNAHRRGG